MNPGQQQFYDFFMERIKEDKVEEAKTILQENFKKQDEGTFTKEYMQESMAKLMSFVKPEFLEDLKNAAAHMNSTLEK